METRDDPAGTYRLASQSRAPHFVTPELLAKGTETITRAEYLAWESEQDEQHG